MNSHSFKYKTVLSHSCILSHSCLVLEHVWQVTMQKRGLGARKNIHGPYRLCLTDQTLSLVKIGAQDNSDSIEISVSLH